MKSSLQNVLTRLRLLDEQHRLSLTNLAVMVSLLRLGISGDQLSDAGLIALAITLICYHAKKVITYFENKAPKPLTENEQLKTELDDLKNKVSSLSMAAGLRPSVQKKF